MTPDSTTPGIDPNLIKAAEIEVFEDAAAAAHDAQTMANDFETLNRQLDRYLAPSARTEQGADLDARDAFLAFRVPRPHAHGDPESYENARERVAGMIRGILAARRSVSGGEATDDPLRYAVESIIAGEVCAYAHEPNDRFGGACNPCVEFSQKLAAQIAARRSVSVTPDLGPHRFVPWSDVQHGGCAKTCAVEGCGKPYYHSDHAAVPANPDAPEMFTRQQFADWVAQHVRFEDDGYGCPQYIERQAVLEAIGDTGCGSLWFTEDEWGAIVEKAGREAKAMPSPSRCSVQMMLCPECEHPMSDLVASPPSCKTRILGEGVCPCPREHRRSQLHTEDTPHG